MVKAKRLYPHHKRGNEMSNKKHYDDIDCVHILHQIATLYTGTKVPHDYGTGEEYSSIEVHTIMHIANEPGITSKDLSIQFGRTKGAISQIIRKLIEKGLVIKSDEQTDKGQPLYLTDKGNELDKAHRAYDRKNFGKSMSPVREKFSEEEIATTFSLLEYWLEIRRDIQQKRMYGDKA